MLEVREVQVRVRPYDHARGHAELRIAVEVNSSETVHYVRALMQDDLSSRFDVLFDAARDQLRAEILKGVK